MKKYDYVMMFLAIVVIVISGCSDARNSDSENETNDVILKETNLSSSKFISFELEKKDGKEAYSNKANTYWEGRCNTDDDCDCGISVLTSECALGNKDLIRNNSVCREFCLGEFGRIELICKDSRCIQR